MKFVLTVVMALLVVVIMTVPVFAVDAPATTSPTQVGQSLGTFLNALYGAALRVVGLAIFVMFLIAGLGKIVPGMAVGNPEAILKDAVIGLIILVSAYVVLNSIHPNLVQLGAGLPVIPAGGSGVQNSNTNPAAAAWQVPVEGDTVTLRSGTASRMFVAPGGPCGGTALSCKPGYTCQGNVCAWAGAETIALNSYCQMSSQCKQPEGAFSEAIVCVSLYEFRNSPGLVQKCCDGDSVSGEGAGGAAYCTH